MAGTVNTIDRTRLPRWLGRQQLTVKNQLICTESREQVEERMAYTFLRSQASCRA
jgi:hypothetical protein